MRPSVEQHIKNYHFEMKEVKEKKTIKTDGEALQLKKTYQKKLEKVR